MSTYHFYPGTNQKYAMRFSRFDWIVCFQTSDPSWKFSFVFICLLFLSFVFVLVAYALMYSDATKHKREMGYRDSSQEDKVLQVKHGGLVVHGAPWPTWTLPTDVMRRPVNVYIVASNWRSTVHHVQYHVLVCIWLRTGKVIQYIVQRAFLFLLKLKPARSHMLL